MSRENLDALKYTYANFRQVQASGRFHHRAESSRDGPETAASYFRSGVIAGMSTLMTVPVQTEGAFTAGSPRPLSGFATSKAATTMLSCPTASISSVSKSRTRGQCDADECRLELECGAGKEITVASGPTSDPRENQVAVFALLLAFNKSAPCASHIFRTRGLNRGAFFLQVAAF